MKRYYLVAILMVIPLFAGQVTLDLAEPQPMTSKVLEKIISVPFVSSRGETLKYDTGVFNNGLGLHSSGAAFTPSPTQTYGFATYFILSTFGITTPHRVSSVQVQFWTIYGADTFRLYVWDNVASAMLRPLSHGTHLYSDFGTPMPPAQTWGSWDLSADSIAVPETVWVGACYNLMTASTANAEWYLALNQGPSDTHSYINLSGTSTAWQALGGLGYGYPYAVRLVVDPVGGAPDTNDVGPVSIDIPSPVPWNTILPPQATVKNFGNVMETFEVTCEIEPGGYSSTDSVIDLAAGDSIQVTFTPDFTFAMEDTYTVTVYTELGGDMDTSNDTMVAKIATYDDGVAEGDWNVPKDFRFTTPAISSGKTNIELALPVAAHVDLQVYDAMGRLSAAVFSQKFSAGTHTMTLDLNLPAGVYFYKLNTDIGENVVKKSVLID